MRKILGFGLFALIGTFFCLNLCFASTPDMIKYQGSLKEKGVLVNGTKTMKFRITDAAGSVETWTSGNVSVQVEQGLFDYVMALPATINWQAGGYYLEVTIGNTVLLPREEIGASVYALQAKSIDDGAITPIKTNIVAISSATGKIPAISSAYFTSLDGSALTNISAGTIDTAVRTSTGTIQNSLNAVITSTGTLLPKAGGVMTGDINATGYRVLASTVGVAGVTKFYGDGSSLTGLAGGGNMNTGVYDLNLNGIADNSEALNGRPEAYFATAASTGAIQDSLNSVIASTGTLDAKKLDKTGGTMSGAVNMSSNSLLNVATMTATGNLLFNGGSDGIPFEGAGTRLMWYPAKSAFRAGYVDGAQWDNVNIGMYSIATGYKTEASGQASTAIGAGTTARGTAATAIGEGTQAFGVASTAIGNGATAFGDFSTAIGLNSYSNGQSSFAMGEFSTAGGGAAAAMGSGASAGGFASIAMGYGSYAGGSASAAIGENVRADAANSITIGKGIDGAQRLINNTPGSFMVGFDRTIPTFTVYQSSVEINGAAGGTGNVLVLSTGTAANHVARIDNTGKGWFNGGTATGGADYAEWFEKEGDCEPGDVIGLNNSTGKARKYISGDALIGIYSVNPGVTGNSDIDKTPEEMKKDHVLVGLMGQLAANTDQINITGRKVTTKDGKQLGYLLSNGKILLKI